MLYCPATTLQFSEESSWVYQTFRAIMNIPRPADNLGDGGSKYPFFVLFHKNDIYTWLPW